MFSCRDNWGPETAASHPIGASDSIEAYCYSVRTSLCAARHQHQHRQPLASRARTGCAGVKAACDRAQQREAARRLWYAAAGLLVALVVAVEDVELGACERVCVCVCGFLGGGGGKSGACVSSQPQLVSLAILTPGPPASDVLLRHTTRTARAPVMVTVFRMRLVPRVDASSYS
jgi:hypothetical protein